MPSKSKKRLLSTDRRAGTPNVEFEKHILDNGLQVIFHIDRKLPVVHVNQWFHVGSKNERPGRTGFAHLFEHLMFQGSSNAKGGYFTYVERAGANLREGGVNGTTSEDRTTYFVTVPSANLEYILWLESDRIATLADSLTQQEFENQRDVVRNERRQGLENQPYGRAFKLISENLYPSGHPYSWPVIGSHEDLLAASMEDVREFFKTYYTPNNLSLCIAGDFDVVEARSLVEKYYGCLILGPALERPGIAPATLLSEKTVEVSDRVPQDRVYMVWPAPHFFGANEPELTLASMILSDGLSSRLHQKLVYNTRICSNVYSFNDASEIAGMFAVVATARPGSQLSDIEKIVSAEIETLAGKGPSERELNRVKAKWEYDYISGLERIGGFGGKADRLNAYNTYLGNPAKYKNDFDRHRTVTREGTRAAAENLLVTHNRLLLRFHPELSRRPAIPEPDRKIIPSLGIDRKFEVPAVRSTRLNNGFEVLVIERHDLPKVSVLFGTKAGSTGDPQHKAGLAHLVVRTIDRGTKSKSALDIENAFGDLGTSLHGIAAREMSYLSMDVLSNNLKKAVSILADVVINPEFSASEFNREKELHLDALTQDANNPNAVASRVRSILAFGSTHPYGRPVRGFPPSIQSIVKNDLTLFHRCAWTPGTSVLIFAGDVTFDEATRIANRKFGMWKNIISASVSVPPAQPASQAKVYLVDRQGAPQTVISQILPGPSRLTEEYYALRLADAVWGAGFTARLNMNLRENKGYTYGASSALALFSKGGYWFSTASVQTDKTKESVIEFIEELRNLGGVKPISESELAEAKTNRVRGFAQQFESIDRIAGIVAELWSFGIPSSEMQRESEALAAASVGQVNEVAQKYAKVEDSMLLLVGDRSKIEDPIRSLNFGEIVFLDEEGRLQD